MYQIYFILEWHVQFSFDVSILTGFLCLFGIEKFDFHRAVHRNIITIVKHSKVK